MFLMAEGLWHSLKRDASIRAIKLLASTRNGGILSMPRRGRRRRVPANEEARDAKQD